MPNYVYNRLLLTRFINNDEGNKAFLDEIHNKICSKNKEGKYVIDFNKIIPTPETLNEYTQDGYETDKLRYYCLTHGYSKESYLKLMQILASYTYTDEDPAIGNKGPLSKPFSVEDYEEWFKKNPVSHEVGYDENHKVIFIDVDTKTKWLRDGELIVTNLSKYKCVDWHEWRIEHWGTKWNACSPTEFSEYKDDSNVYFECNFDTAWDPPRHVVIEISKILNCTVRMFCRFEGETPIGCAQFTNGVQTM